IIFGIPLGQPDHQVQLTLDKKGISFSFNTSLKDIADKIAASAGPEGEALVGMSLGFKDEEGMTFQLPLTGVAQRLLTGQGFTLADFDPVGGNWAIGIDGGIEWQSFQVGQMKGLLFSPGDSTLLDAHVQKLYLDPTQPIDPTKIPIETQKHYDDMV